MKKGLFCMTDSNNDLAKDWYGFAMADLATAKFICNMHPKPLGIICYHCQQSAEKMLKGFLVLNGVNPPKIHDLPLICDMCTEINDNFKELYDICKFLNPFGSQPRYPNEIEILEADAERALRNVQTMYKFFELQGYSLSQTC